MFSLGVTSHFFREIFILNNARNWLKTNIGMPHNALQISWGACASQSTRKIFEAKIINPASKAPNSHLLKKNEITAKSNDTNRRMNRGGELVVMPKISRLISAC